MHNPHPRIVSEYHESVIRGIRIAPYSDYRRGVAALPLALAILAIIIAVGSGILIVSYAQSQAAAAAGRTVQAVQYAEAGARDALMRIARNRDFNNTGGYTIEFVSGGCSGTQEGCVTVTVSTATTPKVIVSTAQVRNTTRALQVDVTFDASSNGEITSVVWTEL
ncbi:MAG: hypothetical protein A2991_02150 [Candidatus Terrybacteria bacterium RIFCSPLOWO2_01_FULL_58_14]|uniref:Type 4 fimbrial biogenesis protein PilX N-terminal domain-containing protein n=2 Tax=Candidatus Terryibacteriota TaxID=1817920 RepID=A0A1G2PZ83_9BACT|nr:MAG: hypothetical protein A2682_03060 [Candidatus Terrybacteria bacterium RIFCSPHIGHO2_01_FULL_58_15]OHA53636.1 MAG: hypothetical protein A2991_02150 [Candidatus Terrybacteria bacterium RIFCSPLOWO2_01_FULL_58_14]